MKAFIIKNKEGKYKTESVGVAIQSYFLRDIRCAEIFTDKEVAKSFCPSDCEVVEITIAEGDLEEKNRVLKRAFDKMLADLMNYVREYQENSTNEYAIACCKDILSQMWHARHNQDLFIEQAKGGKDGINN